MTPETSARSLLIYFVYHLQYTRLLVRVGGMSGADLHQPYLFKASRPSKGKQGTKRIYREGLVGNFMTFLAQGICNLDNFGWG